MLNYNPSTGYVTWKTPSKYKPMIKAGDRAGYIHHRGYRWICIDNKEYQEHRFIWFWMTGKWPPNQIDHLDGNKANNMWSNLRLATNGQNQANTQLRKTNTTGYKGVTWNKKLKAYIAQHRGHLGVFSTAKEAHEKYCQVVQEKYGKYFNKG